MTKEEIEDIIDAEVDARPELAGLTDSNASEWLLWKSTFVDATLSIWYLIKRTLNAFQTVVNAQSKVGSKAWYKIKNQEFQFGDPLIEVDGLLKYAAIDATKQIIKQSATQASNGIVLIKVATEAVVLTTEQKDAFKDYWNDVIPFPQPFRIISAEPDIIKSVMIVYFDGKLIQAEVEAAVEAAIDDYLLNKLDFNGTFNINHYRDAIELGLRALSEDTDVNIEDLQIRPDDGEFTEVDYKYQPFSGRYRMAYPDDAVETDRSTIAYIRI